jgi:hypothetical protein
VTSLTNLTAASEDGVDESRVGVVAPASSGNVVVVERTVVVVDVEVVPAAAATPAPRVRARRPTAVATANGRMRCRLVTGTARNARRLPI